MIKLYEVKLDYNELMFLDGKINEDAAKIIERAKAEKSIGFEFNLINEIICDSLKSGEINWKSKSICSCKYCDKSYSYKKHRAKGKFHKKGDTNYNKPLYYSGIAFNEGFVTFQGMGDCCSECQKKYDVINNIVNYIIEHDLQIELPKYSSQPTRYKKDKAQICFNCGKLIYESEMLKLPAMMGGYYKGECNLCHAKSLPFGQTHKYSPEFRMIKVISE